MMVAPRLGLDDGLVCAYSSLVEVGVRVAQMHSARCFFGG